MAQGLLITAIVIIACVICNKVSNKIGVPMLLAFIVLGMFFGTDGVVKIQFNDYSFAEQICSTALIFIMFYGGFGTRWSAAKPVAAQAIVLTSLGTIVTAGLVGVFCHYVLNIAFLESFLIGAVISSTDAASVFSILRSKRLNLRYNTASLLEIESGSNDPFAYMLTIIILSFMSGDITKSGILYMIFAQIVFGIISGLGVSIITLKFLKKFEISSSGFSAIFMLAIAILSYSLPTIIGGNGYLSAYIAGIVIGNYKLKNKQELVYFFDGMTGLMQMLLFFLLGLVSFPSKLPSVALTAFFISIFLTFIARPIAVFLILSPFKCKINQQLFVSWAGIRGAASIVFAIMAIINQEHLQNDIFHMIFFIVLFSILFQGTLLPYFAKILDMTDPDADVMKTFNDYTDKHPVQFIQFALPAQHQWVGKKVSEILLPPNSLIALLIRDNTKMIPTGETILNAKDLLILGGISIEQTDKSLINDVHLFEKNIDKDHEWVGKRVSEIDFVDDFIVIIKRDKRVLIPNGSIILKAEDILVVADKITV